MQIVRKLWPVTDATEKRRLEILAEIERIKDGRRPIPDSAYTRKGEITEHRFWPPYVVARLARRDDG